VSVKVSDASYFEDTLTGAVLQNPIEYVSVNHIPTDWWKGGTTKFE